MKRNSRLARHKAQQFGIARRNVTKRDIDRFYDNLLKTFTANKYAFDLIDSPQRIWNCDETGFDFDDISRWVIVEKGVKNVRAECPGTHDRTTVMSCVNVAGQVLSDLIILKTGPAICPVDVMEGCEPGTMFRCQKSGWISKDI